MNSMLRLLCVLTAFAEEYIELRNRVSLLENTIGKPLYALFYNNVIFVMFWELKLETCTEMKTNKGK